MTRNTLYKTLLSLTAATLFPFSAALADGDADGGPGGAGGVGESEQNNEEPRFWYVSTTGSDYLWGSQDAPFRTIQRAVNAASSGDQIILAAGTYRPSETIELDGKALSISGDVRFDPGTRPLVTISGDTDGDGVGDIQLIRCTNTNALSWGFNALVLRDGVAVNGGVASIYNSNPDFSRCYFENNSALDREGMIPQLTRSSTGGGALYAYGDSHLTVSGSRFFGNATDGRGGAVYVAEDCHLHQVTSSFVENVSAEDGGAECILGTDYLYSCDYEGNTALGAGGAIFSGDENVLNIAHSTFTGNYSPLNGGAVMSLAGTVVDDSFFDENLCTGGLGKASGVYSALGMNLRNCTFTDNNVGAIDPRESAAVLPHGTVSDCSFEGNTGGPAIKCSNRVSIIDSAFSSNDHDVQIDSADESSFIARCTFAGNGSSDLGLSFSNGNGLVEACSFTGYGWYGLMAYGNCTELEIDDCEFLDGDGSGLLIGNGTLLSNSTIQDNLGDGVEVLEGSLISNCTISGNGGYGIWTSEYSDSPSGIDLIGLGLSDSTICGNTLQQVFDVDLGIGWNGMRGRFSNPYWDLGGNTVSRRCSASAAESESDSSGGQPSRPDRPDRGERPVRNR